MEPLGIREECDGRSDVDLFEWIRCGTQDRTWTMRLEKWFVFTSDAMAMGAMIIGATSMSLGSGRQHWTLQPLQNGWIKLPGEEHPQFDQLKAHFDWETEGGYQIDGVGASGFFHGNAGRVAHGGSDAFMRQGAMPDAARPAMTWLSGTPVSYESIVVDRTVPVPPLSVSEWAVFGNDVNWTALEYAWPHDAVMETRMSTGELLATYPVQGDVGHSCQRHAGVLFSVI